MFRCVAQVSAQDLLDTFPTMTEGWAVRLVRLVSKTKEVGAGQNAENAPSFEALCGT